jgi:hypothetical protein
MTITVRVPRAGITRRPVGRIQQTDGLPATLDPHIAV